jgi:hypothetical protein
MTAAESPAIAPSQRPSSARRLLNWFVAAELAGAASLIVLNMLPDGSGEDIGLGLLYLVLFFGGIALWLAPTLVVLVLVAAKSLDWRDAAWPLVVALIPIAVTVWTIQLYF